MKNLRICIYFLCAAIFIGLSAILHAAPDTTAAETKTPDKTKAPEQEGRYLFLVETSDAMDSSKTALRKSMRSVIESGLNGQIKYGDTIGLWTYNDKMNTDFPMILWRNEHVKDVENAVDYWMSKRKFTHRADITTGLPVLQNIIKASQKLTIIWMSTGNDQITGLPFASEVAELQKEFRDDFRKQHIPFVTLLAVRKGVIVDFTVNPGDAKLRLPEVMEKEAAAPVVVTNVPEPVVEPPPVAKRPPLIIHVGPSPELVLQKSNAAIAALKAAAQSNAVATQNLETNATALPKNDSATNAAVVTNKPVAAVEKPVTPPPAVKTNEVAAAASVQSNSVVVPPVVAATNSVASKSNQNSNPSNVATSTPATPSAPVLVVASPPKSNAILIASGAGALLLLAGIIILLVVKNSNAQKGPSYISQSMTREHLNSGASKPSSDNPAAPD